MKIKAILFDWGGTLAQVVTQEQRLRAGAAAAAGRLAPARPECAEDLIRCVLGAEAEAAAHPELREADLSRGLRAWAGRWELACEEAQLDGAAQCLCDHWHGSLETFPGAPETLAELRRRGYRLGLVSNCMFPLATSQAELERLGLAEHLEFAVFSSAVGYRKPSPRIYDAAVGRLRGGRDSIEMDAILFVGDSPAFDVIAPAALGMKTALVTCHRGIWPAGDYARARPDLRVGSVNELPGLLGDSWSAS